MNTILVVDDSEDILKTIKIFFSRAGYKVITASSGKAGLKAARKEDPDLILLDIAMPQLDGLEVLKKLNADKRTRYIPVIMLTGVDTADAKEEAAFEYADQYVTKPADLALLRSRIERILSLRRTDNA